LSLHRLRSAPHWAYKYRDKHRSIKDLKFTQKHFIYGLLIMVLGYAVHFSEIYYLYSTYQIWPAAHDYVVGTLLIGLGASLMALSNHPLLNVKSLSILGKYTLGIYAIHFVFVDILRHYDRKISNPAWEIGYVFIVLLLSVGVTIVLSKNNWLKKVFV
jgi:surface polysaccharide O-acyltransferase-like enzyme